MCCHVILSGQGVHEWLKLCCHALLSGLGSLLNPAVFLQSDRKITSGPVNKTLMT